MTRTVPPRLPVWLSRNSTRRILPLLRSAHQPQNTALKSRTSPPRLLRSPVSRPALNSQSYTLYGARRNVIEYWGWLFTLLVLGAPRSSPLTRVKHAKELNAPTATVQLSCRQNQRTSRLLRHHL